MRDSSAVIPVAEVMRDFVTLDLSSTVPVHGGVGTVSRCVVMLPDDGALAMPSCFKLPP